jgi:hypothetical protein
LSTDRTRSVNLLFVKKRSLRITESRIDRVTHCEQATQSDKVVNVAGRGQQDMWTADIIGLCVDLRRLSAARATDGVVEGALFAPAAERWALT